MGENGEGTKKRKLAVRKQLQDAGCGMGNVVSGGVMAMRAARGTRLMEDHCTGYINV